MNEQCFPDEVEYPKHKTFQVRVGPPEMKADEASALHGAAQEIVHNAEYALGRCLGTVLTAVEAVMPEGSQLTALKSLIRASVTDVRRSIEPDTWATMEAVARFIDRDWSKIQ